MDNFDLIGALSDYATANSWAFLYGDEAYKNFAASKNDYITNQLILGANPFTATPVITNAGKISQISYNGLLMLGRKFEVSTAATLDETYIQKYNRRLLELSQLLATNIAAFACAEELEVSSSIFELRINSYDSNIDFVVGNITFLQWP